jgi:hypothetical protein
MRLGLLLSTVLFVLALVPTATANRPIREIIPAPDDLVITGQCAFPVRAHFEGREIDTTFTDRAGDPVKLLGVFPGNMLTVTNLDTGRSIRVPATRVLPAASPARRLGVHEGDRPRALDPESRNRRVGALVPERPGERRVQRRETTSVRNTGTLEDLCLVLAS